MKILAYDSSSEVLSVGLFEDEAVIGELESAHFTRHTSTLAPAIDRLLKSHRMTLTDIDVIAVGLGPGSFTGLRVGVTTAKVLAYSAQKKLIGVSSFEALAAALPAWSGRKGIALDAKRGKYYAALFEMKNGAPAIVGKPGLVNAAELARWEKRGAEVLKDGDLGRPKASGVVKAASALIRRKKFADPYKVEPLYLHPRDCNVTRKS
jgi:tRNA threonylcarbamoyladenosine biosynthesis protein TsaB